MITAERVRELLSYDPATGILTWRVHRGGKAKKGERAGSPDRKGARQISFGGRVLREHRLIWLYMTGRWPDPEVDHGNGNSEDNRWKNLREATSRFNKENRRRANKNNSTGLLGVSEYDDKFRARITVGGREIWLGRFDTASAAHQAYVEAKRKLHEGGTL